MIHRTQTIITRAISAVLPTQRDITAGDIHAVHMACERAHRREAQPMNKYTANDPRHPIWQRHAERIRLRGTQPREVQEG